MQRRKTKDPGPQNNSRIPKPAVDTVVKWPPAEHALFLEAMQAMPKKWKAISKLIISRTPEECKRYAASMKAQKQPSVQPLP